MIKPSEVCVHTAKVMEDLLPLYIDKVRKRLESISMKAFSDLITQALFSYFSNNYQDYCVLLKD